MIVRLATVVVILLLAGAARAQPTNGNRLQLEVDDCATTVETQSEQDRTRLVRERFDRGNTLYLQGDYTGSVRELIGAYCTVPFYQILYNIGQSYERLLEYEKAIEYLQRYADAIPPDAKKQNPCDVDPQIDKQNTLRRIEVLKRLDARLFVETNPKDATVTISSKDRRVAYSDSGKEILVGGGTYEMIVEKVGHVPEKREITVRIGKPHTFYFELKREAGRLSIQTTPPDARIFLDKRFIGVGSATEEALPATKYQLLVEANGREDRRETIEVLPNQENRFNIELEPKPQFARRQLIVYGGIAGAISTGQLLYAFEDTVIAGVGGVAGVAAGLLGTYLYLPEDVPVGTANLTITTSLATSIAGLGTALLFTEDQAIIEPVLGATLIAGAGAGYYFGQRTKVSPGDAALLNSTMFWGAAAGVGFGFSFGAGRELSAGLVLSGLGMGTIGGLVMTNYYEISRTHAALIDVGGVIGLIGGFAAESLAYRDDQNAQRSKEHAANFALAGMGIGLIAAGVLTRNFDDPTIPVTPTLGTATNADGSKTATYGIGVRW